MKKLLISLVFVLLFVSCGETGKKDIGKPEGSEGGPCYGNGSCDGDLVCENDICVSPEELSDTDTGNTGNTGNSGNSGDTGDTGNSGNTGGDDTVVPDDDSETVVDNEHPDVDNYSPKCGNNILDEGEFCEVGEKIECSDIEGESYPEGKYTVCKSDCSGWRDTLCGTCGNSVKDPDETCDAGVVIDCSLIPDKGYKAGITATCNDTCSGWNDEEECALTTCGDGILDEGETCEKGTITDCSMIPGKTYVSGTTATCNDICTGWNDIIVCSLCGNGILDFGEECDDGNTSNNDDCKNDCTQNVCGDTYIRTGKEECDDGNSSNNDACLNSCKLNVCGDGYVKAGEECDDGNSSNNDECLNSCKLNICGDGYIKTGEECDDGDLINNDGCDINCTFTGCGNGIVTEGEECDDGNSSNNDECLNICKLNICGDGYIKTGEECDDGNLINNDGCDINCTFTGCGNGIVTEGEECDDGNSINDDGCTNNCEIYIDPLKKFDGIWAQKIITTSYIETTIPVLGQQQSTSVTQKMLIVDMKYEDGILKATSTTCYVETDTGSQYLDISFSQLYIDSLVPIEYEFTVEENGSAYDLTMEDFVDVTGAKLNDPLADDLPTDKTDSRVWDQDGDGNPGLRVDVDGRIPTLFYESGTADVATKTAADIALSTMDDNTIQGPFLWYGYFIVYQASNNILMNDRIIIPDHNNSSIKFVRIDDSYNCDKIISEKDTLFQ
jgi:cysteine-rich repeat protein